MKQPTANLEAISNALVGAEAKALQITAEAKGEATQIIAEAKDEAAKITTEAKDDAARTVGSAHMELQRIRQEQSGAAFEISSLIKRLKEVVTVNVE